MTTNSITSSQRKQVVRFMEDGLDALTLDKDGAQRIIENGGEFQVGLKELIQKHSVTNQFADEEAQSGYAYPMEYKGPKPIVDQIKAIARIFGLDSSQAIKFAKNLPALPEGAEGWFAIPQWQMFAPTYGEAVGKVLAMIGSKRKFYNYRDGQLGADYLRQHAKTVKMFQKLGDEQKANGQNCDILVVPAQFGLRHKGRSVRRAREVYTRNEFGLGAFAIGIMVLTHPERLVQWEQLHIDCAGDEFSLDAAVDFSRAPVLGFDEDEVKFYAYWIDAAEEYYGSATGFLSQ